MSGKKEECVCSSNTDLSFMKAPYCQFPNAGRNNLFQCPHCRQRWFCYNEHLRLWGKVEDDLTWKFLINDIDVPIVVGGICKVAPGYEEYAIDPVSKICTKRVLQPTVRMEKILDDETAVVQWTGDYSRKNIFGHQFAFPIAASLEKYEENLSSLRVIFLGQLKYCPHQEQAKGMAEHFDDPEMKKCVVHLMSADHAHDYGDGKIGPSSFMSEIVLLGDPNVGVIRPALYNNQFSAGMIIEEFDRKNKAEGVHQQF